MKLYDPQTAELADGQKIIHQPRLDMLVGYTLVVVAIVWKSLVLIGQEGKPKKSSECS